MTAPDTTVSGPRASYKKPWKRIGQAVPKRGRRTSHGYCTGIALHSTAVGSFALLFQFGFAPAEDRQGKSHQFAGTAGWHPQLPRFFHLPAHLPDPGRAPFHP